MNARSGVAAFVMLCATLGSGCGPTKKAEVDEKLPPQVTLYGVRLHSWEGPELVSRGRAAKLTYDRASANFEAAEALVQFPARRNGAHQTPRQMKSDLELRAPRAQGNLQSRQADGSGGVTVRSASGLVARTDAAHFDGLGLVVTGGTPVQLRGPGYALDANGFTFNFATEELLFDGDVRSRLGQAGPIR